MKGRKTPDEFGQYLAVVKQAADISKNKRTKLTEKIAACAGKFMGAVREPG